MIERNLLAWSLQAGALILIAGATAALIRLRLPAARLFYWQMALLGCLALPVMRPWTHEWASDNISISTVLLAQPAASSGGFHLPLDRAVLWLLFAGVLVRAVWLGIGFFRLRLYRLRSHTLNTCEGATLLLSDDVTSPVTFGAFRPVVLLPAGFADMDSRTREAILCHELLHIRRRDWVFTVIEELIRTVLWFHPAIWWLLGQIQLAREQTVDREVVARTNAREQYVDALLAIAGARPQADLAPAPLFLRKRHLKKRVVSILKEVRMSKAHLLSALAASLSILVAAGWMLTAAFPLAAAPENDSPGVSVNLNGAALLHRSPVLYPEAARAQNIQGTVLLQVEIDNRGNVSDANVLSGPQELRKAALQSVLTWHFAPEATGTTRQVAITFQATTVRQLPPEMPAPAPPASVATNTPPIKSIGISGLTDQARTDLLSRLPVREGQTLSQESLRQLVQTVRNFDEHLAVAAVPSDSGVTITIQPQATPPDALPPARIRVGGNVQAVKLIDQPRPKYPADAKAARIQGVVSLRAIIGKDGTVQDLSVISGHPLLVPAALEAVRHWVYQPTLLNGVPTEVETQVDINFTLSQ